VGKAQDARYALVAGFAGEIMRNSDVVEREREREKASYCTRNGGFGFIAANGQESIATAITAFQPNDRFQDSDTRRTRSFSPRVIGSLGAIRDGEGGREVNSL